MSVVGGVRGGKGYVRIACGMWVKEGTSFQSVKPIEMGHPELFRGEKTQVSKARPGAPGLLAS